MTFSPGDTITNSLGNNQGTVMAVLGDLIAVKWHQRGGRKQGSENILWHTVEFARESGWEKVDDQKASISCGKCGQILPEDVWPMARLK